MPLSISIPPEITDLGPDFIALYQQLPAFPDREAFCKIAGCVHPRSLANKDSAGVGPSGRRAIGAKICYPRASAVVWLAGQLKTPKPRPWAFKKTVQDL